MVGRNSLVLCMSECKRLLEIALKQEVFLKGEFKVTDIKINSISYGHEIEITVEGVDNVNE